MMHGALRRKQETRIMGEVSIGGNLPLQVFLFNEYKRLEGGNVNVSCVDVSCIRHTPRIPSFKFSTATYATQTWLVSSKTITG